MPPSHHKWNLHMKKINHLLFLISLSSANHVLAEPSDSIIQKTDNEWIVNIDSTNYAIDSNKIYLTLDAGDYEIKTISKAEGGAFTAWKAWSDNNCQKNNGCEIGYHGFLTLFGMQSPSITSFNDITIDTSTTGKQNLKNCSYDTGYNGYISCFNSTPGSFKVYPTENLAFQAEPITAKFHMQHKESVGFFVIDTQSKLNDNAGGLSLLITKTTMEQSNNIVKGSFSWATPITTVKCVNNTTKETKTYRTKSSIYNCEKAGLIINTGDSVSVTVTAVKK